MHAEPKDPSGIFMGNDDNLHVSHSPKVLIHSISLPPRISMTLKTTILVVLTLDPYLPLIFIQIASVTSFFYFGLQFFFPFLLYFQEWRQLGFFFYSTFQEWTQPRKFLGMFRLTFKKLFWKMFRLTLKLKLVTS